MHDVCVCVSLLFCIHTHKLIHKNIIQIENTKQTANVVVEET